MKRKTKAAPAFPYKSERVLSVGPYKIPVYRVPQNMLKLVATDAGAPTGDDEYISGCYCGNNPEQPKAIFILASLVSTDYWDCLLHELGHAIIDIFGLAADWSEKQEEEFLATFCPIFLQALNS